MNKERMIVCLGWGSLIWDPRDLALASKAVEDWQVDGPLLPIEFLRESSGKRITLVLDQGAQPIRVLWAPMASRDLASAANSLAHREGSPRVGCWPTNEHSLCLDLVRLWAETKGFGGVVWTALGAKFDGIEGRVPVLNEVLAYLRQLVAEGESSAAEEYVRKAPYQIQTQYREAIARTLGWTPVQ